MATYTLYSTDTKTTLAITPIADANSAQPGSLISLSGATGGQVRFSPTTQPNAADFTGTGTVAFGTSTVNYKPSVSDLSVPGVYQVQVTIQFGSQSLPLQPFLLNVVEAL